jgi:predicted DNA-binding protein with PD1-like motif
MIVIADSHQTHLLRFDKGDDVIELLKEYCVEKKITAAHFTCIGACEKVLLSFYDLHKKEYIDNLVDEELEITGVIGNIATMDDQTVVHAHGTFGNQKYEILGGHIKTLIISATGEVFLTVLDKPMKRAFDEPTGLNLLKE